MAAAGATEVVDLGADDSSRSPSPSSDAIDGDNAGGSDYEPTSVARPSVTSTRQQQQQQRTGAGGRPNRAGAAAAAAAAAAGSPTKRKMPAAKDRQIGPEDYEDFTAGGHAQQQEGASGSNGADPREGRNAAAAYGRLLDLDYPRGMLRHLQEGKAYHVYDLQTTAMSLRDSTRQWRNNPSSNSSRQGKLCQRTSPLQSQ